MISTLAIKGLLSFGPDSRPISFGPLNVLIGPNGAGKTNTLEILRLLRAMTNSLTAHFGEAGGGNTWLWRGLETREASVECTTRLPYMRGTPLVHRIEFMMTAFALHVYKESICVASSDHRHHRHVLYNLEHGKRTLSPIGQKPNAQGPNSPTPKSIKLDQIKLAHDESILSQFRDPMDSPEMYFLTTAYAGVRVYGDWIFGRKSPARSPQPADLRSDGLTESADNLGLVMNRLRNDPISRGDLIEGVKLIFDGAEDVGVLIQANSVQIYLHEHGWAIPGTRLSDGSLRFLSLLAILCDPTPPPLICIEEPELGLHPDLLPSVARLLVAASKRTQVVITTHSETIVDALADVPESILVCERINGSTQIERPSSAALAAWLKNATPGQLWRRGQLGGNRW